ncbi:hypothetical protein BDW22DRAFT_1330128 [Trametopsis cervina]|nr:hypothetical protein BDW22DRAFT_1330128 [Trametopsis cervina]
MARLNKSLTLARLEDLTLGVFGNVPMSSTLKHLIDYLSTWGGTDLYYQVVQYSLKLLVPYLRWRARLQHSVGRRASPTTDAAPGLAKLAGLVADARSLFSFWGMLPMIRWLISLEHNPPPTRKLLTIERLQAWSLLLFYPLDHAQFLISHSVIPAKTSSPFLARSAKVTTKALDGTVSLDAGKLSRLSCQLWLLYIVMQFAHLREDRKILLSEERSLNKSKAISAQAAKAKVKERWQFLWTELLTNACNLPCALHWSLEGGFFKNNLWVDILSLIAAVVSWRSGWRAITAPAAPASSSSDEAANPPPSADLVTDLDIQAPIGLEAGLDEI